MATLTGTDAIAYARDVDRHVWHRPDAGGAAQALSADAAEQLADSERERVFISLAYTGYVITDREEILLQLQADNEHGFDLTDGTDSWPGGIDKAKLVRPIRESQVPENIRSRLDPLRQR